MSAKICQCCGGTGWEGSECSDLRVKLLDLQRENDRLRESFRVWDGVDPDKWLETLRGHDTPETEVDL